MKTSAITLCASTLLVSTSAFAQSSSTEEETHSTTQETVVVPSTLPSDEAPRDDHSELRGVFLKLSGGVEGYTGALAPRIRPGETAGSSISFKPTKVFGLELGYSGALNQINTATYPGANSASGADLIRNGGSLLALIGLSVTHVYPYVLAGVAVDSYSVRDGRAVGFHDDLSTAIPVGAGLRSQIGKYFVIDARVAWMIPVGQEFAPGVVRQSLFGLPSNNSGRYQGTLGFGVRL